MAGMRDELKTMAEGFRWGRRPLVPRIGRAVRAREGRPDLPDRLGPDRGRHGGAAA